MTWRPAKEFAQEKFKVLSQLLLSNKGNKIAVAVMTMGGQF
jgi:hypothetical protein